VLWSATRSKARWKPTGHRPRSCNQLRHDPAVDPAINSQGAKDDARSPRGFRLIDIAEHHGDIMPVVHEIAGAWPDEDMNGLRDGRERARHETGRRGHSAIVKRAAQLNAVNALGVSSERAADRLDGSFNEEGSEIHRYACSAPSQKKYRFISARNSCVIGNPDLDPMTLSIPHRAQSAVWSSSIQKAISVGG
jgi:hypothetical protein